MLSTVLVYSCPEASAVRLKMTYSSSKASVVAAAAEAGVTFDHMVRCFVISPRPLHLLCTRKVVLVVVVLLVADSSTCACNDIIFFW